MTKPSAARRAAAALRAYTSVLPSGPREGDAEAILTLAAVLLREDRENARLRRAVEAWREDKVAMKAIFNCRPGICTTCDLMRVAHSLAKPKAKREPKTARHVCGLAGYRPGVDPTCPACKGLFVPVKPKAGRK